MRTKHIIAIAAMLVALLVAVMSVPSAALAVDVGDSKEYTNQLMSTPSDGKNQEWDEDVITDVPGYEAVSSDGNSFAAHAVQVMQGFAAAVMGLTLVLFVVKMSGRALISMSLKDEDAVRSIPTFFLTGKERSKRKAPALIVLRGGFSGKSDADGIRGTDGPSITRRYGPTFLSEHPYREFMVEFVILFSIACAAFALLSLILGLMSGFFSSVTDAAPGISDFNAFGLSN